MSETEIHTGKLTKYMLPDNNEHLARDLCVKRGIEKDEYYDNWIDVLKGECDDVLFINGIFYQVDDTGDVKGDEDIAKATENPDGTISYLVKYYNGGCGFGEAIEEALKNLNE